VDDHGAQGRVARVEALLEQVEGLAPGGPRDVALELVQALLDLYGEGLGRIVEHVSAADESGALAAALAGDELVAHLLLLHGLHPVPVERRVREALDSVRPYLDSHGGGVELLSLDDGVAHLKLEGSCNGCPSSRVTLQSAIEDAIQTAAPDVARIEADGVSNGNGNGNGDGDGSGGGLLQIETVGRPAPKRSWTQAGALPGLAGGQTLVQDVAGEALLFCRLERRMYAYRSGCPCCGASLGDGVLAGTQLECSGCGHTFDVRRAGRCVDAPEWHLDPVPLLVDHDGGVKVAVA
jgi:Fe-S cluster biogenesis protein NfuA/nitrite reductase/ring-hydroxylating ferredoxin subunit